MRLITFMVSIAAVSLVTVHAGRLKHSLTENGALNLLLETLKRNHVYDKRISLDCATFVTDDTTRVYFEFAMHEKHTAKCGGDPESSPVVDRYRVHRASGEIELYDLMNDRWNSYKSGKTK